MVAFGKISSIFPMDASPNLLASTVVHAVRGPNRLELRRRGVCSLACITVGTSIIYINKLQKFKRIFCASKPDLILVVEVISYQGVCFYRGSCLVFAFVFVHISYDNITAVVVWLYVLYIERVYTCSRGYPGIPFNPSRNAL